MTAGGDVGKPEAGCVLWIICSAASKQTLFRPNCSQMLQARQMDSATYLVFDL